MGEAGTCCRHVRHFQTPLSFQLDSGAYQIIIKNSFRYIRAFPSWGNLILTENVFHKTFWCKAQKQSRKDGSCCANTVILRQIYDLQLHGQLLLFISCHILASTANTMAVPP